MALSSLITNAGTLSGSGMALSTTNIVATGALLTAMQSTACTVVVEMEGQADDGGNHGVLTWNSDNDWLILGTTGGIDKVRTRCNSVTINSPNATYFPGRSLLALALDGSGRTVCLNGRWGVTTDANAYASRTSVGLGVFVGAASGGYMRRLWVFTRRCHC